MRLNRTAMVAVAALSLLAAFRVGAQPPERRQRLYDRLDSGIALLLAEADFSATSRPRRVSRAPDDAHSTGAERTHDLVRTQALPRAEAHGTGE